MQMQYKVKWQETVPLEEQLKIGMKSIELKQQGKLEEADRVFKQIPLDPPLAMLLKKRLGPDFLIQGGWNLADANLAYGTDWLNK